MKNPKVEAALVAIVAGGASALLMSYRLAAPGSGERRPTVALEIPAPRSGPVEPALVRPDELLAQVEELRTDNLALRERIEALENRPQPAHRVPIETAEVEPAFEQEVRDWMASMRGKAGPDDFLGSVEQALSQIHEEERVADERQEAARAAERREERLTKLAQELGLSQYQVGEMRTLWSAQDMARDELRRIREESGERDAYKEARQELREENDRALARILSPQQLASYQERDERRDRVGAMEELFRKARSARSRGDT